MTILISGGCKNGKSSLAQDFACEMAQKIDSQPIYFATMIPRDDEDDERIEKHRTDRKNLGFETIECGKNLSSAIEHMESGRVVLFDSLTALVANELFSEDESQNPSESVSPNCDAAIQNGGSKSFFSELAQKSARIAQKIQSDLSHLIEKSASVIFVSDGIFRDGKIYGETTELYRKILAKTENFIAQKSDKVVEMLVGNRSERCAESSVQLGGANREAHKTSSFSVFPSHLIIGGAYQGKTLWAKSEFSLSDDDICICTESELPDFSKKCLSHYENYVAYCLKNNLSPKTDFSNCVSGVSGADKRKIIICDDIFCGVVPIDSFLRKWREETGLALQKIAKTANVTRIFCGIAERLK